MTKPTNQKEINKKEKERRNATRGCTQGLQSIRRVRVRRPPRTRGDVPVQEILSLSLCLTFSLPVFGSIVSSFSLTVSYSTIISPTLSPFSLPLALARCFWLAVQTGCDFVSSGEIPVLTGTAFFFCYSRKCLRVLRVYSASLKRSFLPLCFPPMTPPIYSRNILKRPPLRRGKRTPIKRRGDWKRRTIMFCEIPKVIRKIFRIFSDELMRPQKLTQVTFHVLVRSAASPATNLEYSLIFFLFHEA